jgi:hypothetical protein
MLSKKAQHYSLLFILLFISIISIFITISVLQKNNSSPTGLVIDENLQKQVADQEVLARQSSGLNVNCDDKDSWFRRFTCSLGVEHWFYHVSETTTMYVVDGDGKVVDAKVISDSSSEDAE